MCVFVLNVNTKRIDRIKCSVEKPKSFGAVFTIERFPRKYTQQHARDFEVKTSQKYNERICSSGSRTERVVYDYSGTLGLFEVSEKNVLPKFHPLKDAIFEMQHVAAILVSKYIRFTPESVQVSMSYTG